MICEFGGMGASPRLGFWVVVLLILFLMGVGCAVAPMPEPKSIPICEECDIAPDCPADFGREWKEAERGADNLEDALVAALERAEACEKAFGRMLRKSN
jgi:hypothetical protein